MVTEGAPEREVFEIDLEEHARQRREERSFEAKGTTQRHDIKGKTMICEKLSLVEQGKVAGRDQAAKGGSGPFWEAFAPVGELRLFPVGRGSHQRV